MTGAGMRSRWMRWNESGFSSAGCPSTRELNEFFADSYFCRRILARLDVRYLKGSIVLTDRDRDLLHFVADARYITHTQLFQLAGLKMVEFNRQVFNWRVRRLVNAGLLRRRVAPYLGTDALYSMNHPFAGDSRGELLDGQRKTEYWSKVIAEQEEEKTRFGL
jgi:hypothetical protein